MLAFIMPMYGDTGHGSSAADVTPYLTSVDTIEALTGLDFFTAIDEDTEQQIERIVRAELWETD